MGGGEAVEVLVSSPLILWVFFWFDTESGGLGKKEASWRDRCVSEKSYHSVACSFVVAPEQSSRWKCHIGRRNGGGGGKVGFEGGEQFVETVVGFGWSV